MGIPYRADRLSGCLPGNLSARNPFAVLLRPMPARVLQPCETQSTTPADETRKSPPPPCESQRRDCRGGARGTSRARERRRAVEDSGGPSGGPAELKPAAEN